VAYGLVTARGSALNGSRLRLARPLPTPPCDRLFGVPAGVARCREAEGCGKAEAGAVTLPTLAVHCRPDPSSHGAEGYKAKEFYSVANSDLFRR